MSPWDKYSGMLPSKPCNICVMYHAKKSGSLIHVPEKRAEYAWYVIFPPLM